MSHPHSPIPGTPPVVPSLPLPWEPALTQLRELDEAQLDTLVTRWLTAIGLTDVRVRQHQGHSATYQAILGRPPLATPIHIRLYQRQNDLQVHHVDAFRGYLQRMGIAGGLLITTGGCARQATLVAGATQAPQVCLLAGEQWAALLAAERAGVRTACLPRWIVDLHRTWCWRGRRSGNTAGEP
jgi:restriction endonuclease Mrr